MLPDTTSEKIPKEHIAKYNDDPTIDGDTRTAAFACAHDPTGCYLRSIDHRKDVDGFHPMNVGRLTIGQPCYRLLHTGQASWNCSNTIHFPPSQKRRGGGWSQ